MILKVKKISEIPKGKKNFREKKSDKFRYKGEILSSFVRVLQKEKIVKNLRNEMYFTFGITGSVRNGITKDIGKSVVILCVDVKLDWGNGDIDNVNREIFFPKIIMENLGLKNGDKIEIIQQIFEHKIDKIKLVTLQRVDVKLWVYGRVFGNCDVIKIPVDYFSDKGDVFAEYKIEFNCENGKEKGKFGIVSKDSKIYFVSSKMITDYSKYLLNSIGNKQEKSLMKLFKYNFDCYDNRNVEVVNNYKPPNSFLIHGTRGIGKFVLVLSICKKLNLKCFKFTPSDIYSKIFKGKKEYSKLRKLYNKTLMFKSVVIFDEIESLFPEEEDNKDMNLVKEMLNLLEKLNKTIVVGITSNIKKFDSYLRKKFEEEIYVDSPNFLERFELYKNVLKFYSIPFNEEEIKLINTMSHGFVNTDIFLFCKRIINDYGKNVTYENFLKELKEYKPIALVKKYISIGTTQITNVKWSDIGGLDNVKKQLKEMIVWPLKFRKSFIKMGITPISGLLLYGPPGCGKTLIAKAISTESKSNFISINIPDLIKSEIGESEKAISNVFKQAKLAQPCVIFFDEIQAMFGNRMEIGKHERKLVSQLLLELDSLKYISNDSNVFFNVLVIAATNIPQAIDPCLFRAGRFERKLFVGTPNEKARKKIFQIQFQKLKIDEDVRNSIDEFVKKTDHFTGADIVNLCQKAGLNALKKIETKENILIKKKNFNEVLRTFKRSYYKDYFKI